MSARAKRTERYDRRAGKEGGVEVKDTHICECNTHICIQRNVLSHTASAAATTITYMAHIGIYRDLNAAYCAVHE